MKKELYIGFLLVYTVNCFAQVVSNSAGTTVNVTGGVVISGGSVSNSGTVSNASTISLSGTYTNNGTTSGGGTYNIGGNWLNSGIFIPGISTVNFNGSSLQTIGGSKPSPFYNITVNGFGIALSQNASCLSVFTLTSGTVGGSDTMTLISNASGTARFAQVGTGVTQSSVTAMFTVQRYEYQRTKANYIALSSSVGNTIGETYKGNTLGTVGDWNVLNRGPVFYMSGIGGPDGNAGSYISVKRYVESTNAYNNITAYASPGIKYNARQGEGLFLWMGTGLSTMITPFSFNTHGIPNIGPESIAVTYTSGKGNGFNIIGNPYASPIDWATFLASNSTLQSSFYLMEQDGTWHTFTSGSIPAEQGFGVMTNSNATINFYESHKTIVDASMLRAINPSEEPNTAMFTITNDSNDFACPTIVSFGSTYSKDYNSAEDAYYIAGFVKQVPVIYTTSEDNKNLMLNKLPDDENSIDVPLTAIANVEQANYFITATGLDKLTSYNCVLLIDKASGAVLNNFMDNAMYWFTSDYAPQEKDYLLRFSRGQQCTAVSSAAGDNVQIYNYQQQAVVSFHLVQDEDVVISMYNMLGQKICPDITRTVKDQKITMNFPQESGVYIIRVQSAYGVTTQKLTITW